MSSDIVSKIGKYDVLDVLGQGGMGIVYRAVDSKIGRLVAIKMMTSGYSGNPELLKRFYREAQSAGKLQHPNIVTIYDLGDEGGNPYMVMEFMQGEPLDKIIDERKPMPLADRLGVVVQMSSALHYAHQNGIVHRDIKPANVMVLQDGTVKLLDFGIARVSDNSMTKTGQIMGTINYMSPEQLRGQADSRSDVFSAGVVLFELLTGALPFDAGDTPSTIHRILNEPPPPLKNYIAEYPDELEFVFDKVLAKDREDRYATAEDFGFELLGIQEGLKRTMLTEYINHARDLIKSKDLVKAKEKLLEVLKSDNHNTDAKMLMSEVQQSISKQQRAEQVNQLKVHANDAFEHNHLNDAISYLDQAIRLDKTNPDLQLFRDKVLEKKQRREQLEVLLRQAEQARSSGKYETAQDAAQKAVDLDSTDTQAKAALAAIVKEAQEAEKNKKIRELIDDAKKGISVRRFTEAFDVLKKAEQIDPMNAEVHQLIQLVTTGKEQEQKRKDLDQWTAQIEDALAADKLAEAVKKCDEALQKFASEPALLKLKATVDKKKEEVDLKSYVEEQAISARKLMDAGKADEALDILEKALLRARGDQRLRQLIAIARESADQERTKKLKADYLHKAKDAIAKKTFGDAVQVLETAEAQLPGDHELTELLNYAREEAAAQEKHQILEKALSEANALLKQEEYDRAIDRLETALQKIKDDADLKSLLEQAKQQREGFNQRVGKVLESAQRMMDQRKFQDVVKFLEGQPQSFIHSNAYTKLLEQAREQAGKAKVVHDATSKAEQAISRGEFVVAWQVLQAAYKQHGDAPEIQKALKELEGKKSLIAKQALEKVIREARQMLVSREYAKALRTLQGVADLVPSAPPDLKAEWETVKNDAAAGASRQEREKGTMIAGSGLPGLMAGGAGAKASPAFEETVVQAPRRGQAVAVAEPKKSPMLIVAIIVAVLALSGVGYFMFKKPTQTGAPAGPVYLTITATPWANVKSITLANGTTKDVNDQTPLRVEAADGDVKITYDGPDGKEGTTTCKAGAGAPVCALVQSDINVGEIIGNAK
jgi:serine/threonine-protein kinase